MHRVSVHHLEKVYTTHTNYKTLWFWGWFMALGLPPTQKSNGRSSFFHSFPMNNGVSVLGFGSCSFQPFWGVGNHEKWPLIGNQRHQLCHRSKATLRYHDLRLYPVGVPWPSWDGGMHPRMGFAKHNGYTNSYWFIDGLWWLMVLSKTKLCQNPMFNPIGVLLLGQNHDPIQNGAPKR